MTPLDAIRAVMASRLDASPAHVLMCWASHVDADGKAWPGAKRLSELSRLSERTVRASMGALRKAGILLPVGTHTSGTLIERLDLDALAGWVPPAVAAPPATLAPPAVAAPPPCNPCTPPLQQLQDPPAVVAPKGVIEEDREEDREEDKGSRPPADPPPAIREPVLVSPVERPPVADDWTQLAEHYARLPRHQLPASRRKGVGKHLATMLDLIGLDSAVAMLDWWHRGACEKALFLRRGDMKNRPPPKPGAPPAYGVSTLAVHAESYLPFVVAWIEQGRPREHVPLKALSIPEQRARDVISDEPTPIQRKLAEQAAKRAKEKP